MDVDAKVEKLFHLLDVNNSGSLAIEDMVVFFNAHSYPLYSEAVVARVERLYKDVGAIDDIGFDLTMFRSFLGPVSSGNGTLKESELDEVLKLLKEWNTVPPLQTQKPVITTERGAIVRRLNQNRKKHSSTQLKITDNKVISYIGGCLAVRTVNVPSGVTTIAGKAFRGCSSLTSLTLPDTLTTVGYRAFETCMRLSSLTLPEGVTSIQSPSAFRNCRGLRSLSIPSSLTSIPSNTFEGCVNLTSLVFPPTLTSIGFGSFAGCVGLTSLSLPDSVKDVETKAFANCSGLRSLSFPHKLCRVDKDAFLDCKALSSITIRPRVSLAFIVWAVANSKNRHNWKLTSLSRLRNVLRLIVVMTLDRVGPSSLARTIPGAMSGAYIGCSDLAGVLGTLVEAKPKPIFTFRKKATYDWDDDFEDWFRGN